MTREATRSSRRVFAPLCALVLAWRLLTVLAQWEAPRDWHAGLVDAREARLTRALPRAGVGAAAQFERLAMLREHLPQLAQLYVLVDPFGGRGSGDVVAAMRFERLLEPCFVQVLTELPIPCSADTGPRAGRAVYLLDVRADAPARLAGFRHVSSGGHAELWERAP